LEQDQEFRPEAKEKEHEKRKLQDFLKWYLHIDLKDITNYIALAMAIFLLWWGIKTIINSLSLKGP
jgi:hypothetical protein